MSILVARDEPGSRNGATLDDPLVAPDIKGNLALIAVIAPFIVLLIVGGIWWWRRYRKECASGDLDRFPRIAPEVPAPPEERELQRAGIDIGGRWGPTLRWWWIRRAKARGELSTSDGSSLEAQCGTPAPRALELDGLNHKGVGVGSQGPGQSQCGSKIASSTTATTSSKKSSRCSSATADPRDQSSVIHDSAAENARGDESCMNAKHTFLQVDIPVCASDEERPPSPTLSSISSQATREPIRDVLWWEGIDFDEDD
ncbi:hypothetical protein Slin15195_G126070 [Septoria linicola]|uniref:Uncharacterized protein n=1 Tax=Septoria linicola TaxID=215465 RepID=A0A9Q9B5E2_9PEZI|nr:hypothetical protein Slin14017_G082250 [Septoria linicola]USW59288.1 hypothetical protein Slin15195_G126070 [Septoria linicola]